MGRRTEEGENFADQGNFLGEFLTMGWTFASQRVSESAGWRVREVGGAASMPRRVPLARPTVGMAGGGFE